MKEIQRNNTNNSGTCKQLLGSSRGMGKLAGPQALLWYCVSSLSSPKSCSNGQPTSGPWPNHAPIFSSEEGHPILVLAWRGSLRCLLGAIGRLKPHPTKRELVLKWTKMQSSTMFRQPTGNVTDSVLDLFLLRAGCDLLIQLDGPTSSNRNPSSGWLLRVCPGQADSDEETCARQHLSSVGSSTASPNRQPLGPCLVMIKSVLSVDVIMTSLEEELDLFLFFFLRTPRSRLRWFTFAPQVQQTNHSVYPLNHCANRSENRRAAHHENIDLSDRTP